ncbi:Kinase [Aphelenchoides fujianensis]|nr:Kinase [Aphelenchoides fujianensis]
MVHKQTRNVMAVKKVRANDVNEDERRKMQRELNIIIQSQNCSDIVTFFGGECLICMEMMDASLDKFYRLVYKQEQRIPEFAVGFITASVVRALNYLKSELNIIHRDVKPSNILLSGDGFVKICDFGISGYLVDSIAKSQDIGCQIYLAPERLSERRYDIRSDVWALGITLVEICTGHFPYKTWNTVFDQLQSVVNGDPPFMSTGEYSDTNQRPKFQQLMSHVFFQTYDFNEPAVMVVERERFGEYIRKFVQPWEQSDSGVQA